MLFTDFFEILERFDLTLFFDFSADDSNPLKFLQDLDLENLVVFIFLSEFIPIEYFESFEPYLFLYYFGVIDLLNSLQFFDYLLLSLLDNWDLLLLLSFNDLFSDLMDGFLKCLSLDWFLCDVILEAYFET